MSSSKSHWNSTAPAAAPGLQRRSRGDSGSLASDVTEALRADVTSGRYQPGDRLPTEQEMAQALGVSRTVVREAVAALRADGLVVTHQGRGAFVAATAPVLRFHIDATELQTVQQVLAVMELRVGVEVEAASLASQRRTIPQLERLWEMHEVFSRAVASGELATDEDFDFHIAIAEASNNAQFARFFGILGKVVIPRQSIRSGEIEPELRRRYLAEVAAQHARIVDAIERRDPVSAQAAMRGHLETGLSRYRALAARMAE